MTWVETTRRYNTYFALKKTKTQLQEKFKTINKNNPSPNFWTEEQCKVLLMEMEKPEEMNHKVLAMRLIFKEKDKKQLRKKTYALRDKKRAYLSAAATLENKKQDLE